MLYNENSQLFTILLIIQKVHSKNIIDIIYESVVLFISVAKGLKSFNRLEWRIVLM